MNMYVQQGRHPVFLSFDDPLTRNVRFECVMTLLVLAICAAFSAVTPHQVQAQTTTLPTKAPVSKPTAVAAEPVPQDAPADESAPASARVASAAAPSQSRACQPNYAYTASPSPLEISSRTPGFHVSSEGPYYYLVFGNTRTEVSSQLYACGPRDDFAGDASYSVNWTYALIRPEGSELCVLTSVKVGLRTQTLLPSRDGSLPLAAEWNAFSAGLAVHERGHVALSESYAARLYATLRNYPAGDCYTMSPGVETTAQGIVRELGSAHIRYDAATAHGATQGAVW